MQKLCARNIKIVFRYPQKPLSKNNLSYATAIKVNNTNVLSLNEPDRIK